MDPDTCYHDMLAALSARNWGEAFELARSLIGWLRRGGFPPSDHTRAEARIIAGLVYVEARDNERAERRERRRRRRAQA